MSNNMPTSTVSAFPRASSTPTGPAPTGTLTITTDITRYAKAKLGSSVGKTTEGFVRFSTVAGERGAADAERDVRGFAVKCYTEAGNGDLVGHNTPVFFVRDPDKFPDFIRTQKRDPKTHLRSRTAMWDVWSLSPERLHQVTSLCSDRGLPQSSRQMHGSSAHTYRLINATHERCGVTFHFKTMQGIACLTDSEAATLVGVDRESHQRDLFDAVERGDFPTWRLCVHIMLEQDAENTPDNPFDLTKVWPHQESPLIEVGIMARNRHPENDVAEVEQAAFEPSNIVPGISFSPDTMLQFRIFAYADAHRYRLGSTNDASLPVNRPHAATACTDHRDGCMRVDGNDGGAVTDEPNSFGGSVEDPPYMAPPLPIDGEAFRACATIRCSCSTGTVIWSGAPCDPATFTVPTAGARCSTRWSRDIVAGTFGACSAAMRSSPSRTSTSTWRPRASSTRSACPPTSCSKNGSRRSSRGPWDARPTACGASTRAFRYRAQSWDRERRVVAKVEFHFGELFSRVGFIVTNLETDSRAVVRFYNKRGTAEQWIKEGKQAVRMTRLS